MIESYVIGFAEVKRCIASLRPNDFVLVSENIFMLREKATTLPDDVLSSTTPSNHPEAMLIINKNYAKDLILDSDVFAFRKPPNDVPSLAGVTLHLSFAGPNLLDRVKKAWFVSGSLILREHLDVTEKDQGVTFVAPLSCLYSGHFSVRVGKRLSRTWTEQTKCFTGNLSKLWTPGECTKKIHTRQ